MKNNLLNTCLGAIVVIVMLVCIMIPLVETSTTHEVTITEENKGYVHYKKVDSFEFKQIDGLMCLDGTPVKSIYGTSADAPILFDHGLFYVISTGDKYVGMYEKLDGTGFTTTSNMVATVTLSSGTLTFTYGGTPYSYSVSTCLIPSTEGDYVMTTFNYSKTYPVYFRSTDVVYAYATSSSNSGFMKNVGGTFTKLWWQSSGSITDPSNPAFPTVEKDIGNDTFLKINGTCNPSKVIVPATYTYTDVAKDTSIVSTILSLIPIFVAVGILVFFVQSMAKRE